MKNIIFIDEVDFEKTGNILSKVEFDNYEVEWIDPKDDVQSWVKCYLESNHGIGTFVILTTNRNRFSLNFPNNTIQIDDDTDLDKMAKSIAYIMTNFGREDKSLQNVFVVSDTHFYHENIIQYCNRPFSSVEEMNEKLIENWNSVVGKNDKVIHLGDFCFGNKTKVKEMFSRLNGKIDLVMGNHDRHKIQDYYEIGFHRVYDHPVVYQNFFIMSHAPLQWIKDGDVYANIYGHCHNMRMYRDYTSNTACVCVERTNYKPISFNEILLNMKKVNMNDNQTTAIRLH